MSAVRLGYARYIVLAILLLAGCDCRHGSGKTAVWSSGSLLQTHLTYTDESLATIRKRMKDADGPLALVELRPDLMVPKRTIRKIRGPAEGCR